MKMLAATFSDSAPLAPMTRFITDGKHAHYELHDAEVIENREQRGDENDGRQDLKGEDDAVLSARLAHNARHDVAPYGAIAERAENQRRADRRKLQQLANSVAEDLKSRLAGAGLEHDDRKQELQAEPPGHRSQADGPTIGRPRDRNRGDEREPDERLKSFHAILL